MTDRCLAMNVVLWDHATLCFVDLSHSLDQPDGSCGACDLFFLDLPLSTPSESCRSVSCAPPCLLNAGQREELSRLWQVLIEPQVEEPSTAAFCIALPMSSPKSPISTGVQFEKIFK